MYNYIIFSKKSCSLTRYILTYLEDKSILFLNTKRLSYDFNYSAKAIYYTRYYCEEIRSFIVLNRGNQNVERE